MEVRRQSPLRVALVAGERSGDTLGAGLIEALRRRVPEAKFFGIAGDAMVRAGCEPWYHAEELSVMGLAEVLRHLPRLLRIRRSLVRRLLAEPPDLFIGVDSPDFNLPVAGALHDQGIATVQYVSPQVWAWRQSRVHGIRKAIDLVLCVLPFETEFYASHGVPAVFVGHPLADQVPLQVDRQAARAALGLAAGARVLALLPGSRRSEVAQLARPFAETVHWLRRERGAELECVVALASEGLRELFVALTRDLPLVPAPTLVVGQTRRVLAAADLVLTASGTASLEAALMRRPMVVAYRVSWLTYWVWRRMGVARLEHFALPNLLAGRGLVPEFAQGQVTAPQLGEALLRIGGEAERGGDWHRELAAIHTRLRCRADEQAAEAVLDLLARRRRVAI